MTTLKTLAALLLATSTLIGGCAKSSRDENAPSDTGAVKNGAPSDSAIEGQLQDILKDVFFVSEGDYPYEVIEGEAVTEARLTEALVRAKLASIIKKQTSESRDITLKDCRAESLDVNEAIADGDAAVVPADPEDDEFGYMRHDKQLGAALKLMKSELNSVVGFTFGTNENGDQDDFGPVIYVYVGISKTTGKLIAITTEAVYT